MYQYLLVSLAIAAAPTFAPIQQSAFGPSWLSAATSRRSAIGCEATSPYLERR